MFPFLSRKAVKVRQRRAHKCKEPGWLDLNEYNWISKIFKSLHSVDKISQYQWKKAGEFVDSYFKWTLILNFPPMAFALFCRSSL